MSDPTGASADRAASSHERAAEVREPGSAGGSQGDASPPPARGPHACMLCLQDLQESVPTTLPLNEERVLALEQLYPKLLHEVVRPHWLNAKPVEKQLYLLVCQGCWAANRGDAGEGSSAGRDKKRGDQEARDPGSSNEDTENEDDEELAAAVAASIQQTHEDDSVDEAMLALAIEASLAAEEGAG